MPTKITESTAPQSIQDMFKVGAHFGFSKARRHPSFKKYIYGLKNKTEILDLEKTEVLMDKALEYVKKLGSEKKTILFVSSKSEAKEIVKSAAESIGMPFVSGRWIGGTLTNFEQIKKRVARLEDLTTKKEKGELGKYTKKERLMFDREIESLNRFFSGLKSLSKLPDAVFAVDSKKEHIAVTEARSAGVPVIALASTDCDLSQITYPIAANDASRQSIEFFVSKVIESYKNGSILKKD